MVPFQWLLYIKQFQTYRTVLFQWLLCIKPFQTYRT
jgi:hypothetical protein